MNAEKTLEFLERHPLTAKLREEEAARILAQRQEAGARIRELNAEAERTLPELQADVTVAQKALARHDTERQAFVDHVNAARLALMSERLRLDREKSQAETLLLESYDVRIDEAITFFRDKHDELRRRTVCTDTRRDGINLMNLTRRLIKRSNSAAIQDCLSYCQAAIRELEAMKLNPAFDAGRLEELKAGLPDADEMREHSTEKPMEPGPPDPLKLLPSDSQIDWQLGKLTERFKRVMRRSL